MTFELLENCLESLVNYHVSDVKGREGTSGREDLIECEKKSNILCIPAWRFHHHVACFVACTATITQLMMDVSPPTHKVLSALTLLYYTRLSTQFFVQVNGNAITMHNRCRQYLGIRLGFGGGWHCLLCIPLYF